MRSATDHPSVSTARAFLASYPAYVTTAVLDRLRTSQYSYLQADGLAYLDYTGAGLPARAQLAEHAARLTRSCFGNPHSEHPASAASTALIDQAKSAILAHFRASADEYAVIFTHNASAACRLVAEAYPFDAGARFVLTCDNHNSVNGIREFARTSGTPTEYIPFSSDDLRIDEGVVRSALRRRTPVPRPSAGIAPGRRTGLFAYPAQSNFTGVQHPLDWIEVAHEHGYDVLLDAAAYVPGNRLDLSAVRPDFVPVSWYKVFGYPTGVGCLIARREALARLRRPWFSGGTIAAVSVGGDWHALADDETRFEDGTPNFQHVPDVEFGLAWVNGIGFGIIHERMRCLTGWMLRRLGALSHANGEPVVRIHGPAGLAGRGGTVALRVLDPQGQLVDSRIVGCEAAAAGIAVRTGCFCNPGASEAAFGLSEEETTSARFSGAMSADEYYDSAGIAGGAVRASLGLVSNIDDVEALAGFLERTYVDRAASERSRSTAGALIRRVEVHRAVLGPAVLEQRDLVHALG